MRDRQGKQPLRVAVSVEGHVASDCNGEEQHQHEAEKHHEDQSVAHQRTRSGKAIDVDKSLSKQGVGHYHVGEKECPDRERHETRALCGSSGLYSEHLGMDPQEQEPLIETGHKKKLGGRGKVRGFFPLEIRFYL